MFPSFPRPLKSLCIYTLKIKRYKLGPEPMDFLLKINVALIHELFIVTHMFLIKHPHLIIIWSILCCVWYWYDLSGWQKMCVENMVSGLVNCDTHALSLSSSHYHITDLLLSIEVSRFITQFRFVSISLLYSALNIDDCFSSMNNENFIKKIGSTARHQGTGRSAHI